MRSIANKLALLLLIAASLSAQTLQPANGGTGNGYANAASLASQTVAGLGSAGHLGRVKIVIDGASSSDCTVGSGSETVFCKDTGAAWTAVCCAGFVPATRSINTTLPLTGGGALSSDLTLGVNVFTGDSGSGGTTGVVPAPAAGDAAANKFLSAGGGFAAVPSSMVYPGAGIPISTGSAWSTSLSETDGDIIAGVTGAWTKTTALPNGITATTQSLADNSTKVATTAYSDRGILGKQFNGTPGTLSDGMFPQYQSASGKIEQAWVYQKLTGGAEGVPSSGQKMMPDFNVTQPMAFAANFAGSYGSLNKRFGVNPTATATLSVVRTSGGVETQIGAIAIGTGGGFTFTTTGGAAQSAGSGDVISVYNQNPADATMAYPSFTLQAFLGSTAPTLPSTLTGSVMWPAAFTGNNIMLGDADGIHGKDSGVQISTSLNNVNTEVATSAAVTSAMKVIGTATWSASGGSLTKLVKRGVVSNVVRNSTGVFTVSLSPSQINFAATMGISDDATVSTSMEFKGTPDFSASTSSFQIISATISSGPTVRDAGFYSLVLVKY